MVTAEVDLREVIEAVLSQLKSRIRVSKIILFGSYAAGSPKEWSDIDVAIISPDFAELPLWRRQEILAETLTDVDVRLSPIGYSDQDLAEPSYFLSEIICTGKIVYPPLK